PVPIPAVVTLGKVCPQISILVRHGNFLDLTGKVEGHDSSVGQSVVHDLTFQNLDFSIFPNGLFHKDVPPVVVEITDFVIHNGAIDIGDPLTDIPCHVVQAKIIGLVRLHLCGDIGTVIGPSGYTAV